MATRFYLPVSGTAAAAVVVRSDWERSIAAFARRPLVTAKTNSALTDFAALMGSTATSQTCWYQWVSAPLAAQTISGTISMVVRGLEANLAEDAHLAFAARVMQGDSTTLERGLLLLQHTTATEFATSAQTRIHSALAISSVGALEGDRIVIEIGIHAVTAGNAANITLRFGDPSGTADFALTSGLTTDLCPWVELSSTLTFKTTVNAQVDLVQGSTVIATGTISDISTAWQDLTVTLSGAEADAITDYSDLRVRVTGTGTAAGAQLQASWAELQLPPAGVAPPAVTGTGALSAPAPSLSGTAAETFTGTAALAAPAPSLAATGTETFTGTGSLTAPAPTLAGTGVVSALGSGAVTAPAPGLAATGAETLAGTGALTAPAPVLAGTGVETFTGVSALAAPAPALAGTGAETFTGTGALTAPVPALTSTGAETFSGPGAFAAPAPALGGTGTSTISGVSGTGAITAPAPSLAGTGTETGAAITSVGAVSAPAPSLAGLGALRITLVGVIGQTRGGEGLVGTAGGTTSGGTRGSTSVEQRRWTS